MARDAQWAQHQGPPRIDLLPRELVTQRVVRRQRGGVGAAFLLLLVALGGWYVLEHRQLDAARAEVDRERTVAAGLQARRSQLQPLADLEAQIAAADQLRAKVYAREIRFSTVMRDISGIVPDDVWLTSMTAAFKDGTDAAAAAPDTTGTGAAALSPGSPGAGSPVATLTFGGSGLGHVDVGGFLRALARGPRKDGQQVYLNPYFTTSQKAAEGSDTTVSFSATVDLSKAAFSGRYQAPQGTVTP